MLSILLDEAFAIACTVGANFFELCCIVPGFIYVWQLHGYLVETQSVLLLDKKEILPLPYMQP